MSFGKSDPPQPPNPTAVAGAQTSSNVSTAIANAFLNNTNQVTPTGSLTYEPSSTYSFTDPATNQTYNIPRFTARQELTPEQQAIQNNTQRAQTNLSGLAGDQSERLANLLGSPVDISQAPAPGSTTGLSNLPPAMTDFANTGAPQGTFADTGQQAQNFADAGGQQLGLGDAGDITRTFGPADNFSADRSRVEEALFGRLNPQLDRSREQLEQRLADQGIRYGSPAYTAAMDDWNRQANDLRLNVTAQSGAEQQRLFQEAQAQAQFQNQAQQQGYSELLGRGTFANTAQQAAFQQAAARGQFANAAQQAAYEQAQGRGTFANQAQQNTYAQALGRGNFFNAGEQQRMQQAQAVLNAQNAQRANYLQEQYATRQEPINEITALLSGSQVSRPNFVTTPQTSIPTTDIAGLINQNFQQQFANYQAQNQQQQQLLGGVLGLGGNLAVAGTLSDRRAKENIHRMGSVYAVADVDSDERKELPIYQYSYKGDPASVAHVGPMAQDVEKIDPGAVGQTRGGLKTINPRRVMGSILRAT